MFLPVITLTVFCAPSIAHSTLKSFDDAIQALRGAGSTPIFPGSVQSSVAGGSLIESGKPHKPLSVAEFTEWLHNLYYTEEQKRESAIKSLLDTDQAGPQ
jgi:hypothetical protein